MSEMPGGFSADSDGDIYIDPEPDLNWKNQVRERIQAELQPEVDKARRERETRLTHNGRDKTARDLIQRNHELTMAALRAQAQTRYQDALDRERQERRWATGQRLDSPWTDTSKQEQQSLLNQLGLHMHLDHDTPNAYQQYPLAGLSNTNGRTFDQDTDHSRQNASPNFQSSSQIQSTSRNDTHWSADGRGTPNDVRVRTRINSLRGGHEIWRPSMTTDTESIVSSGSGVFATVRPHSSDEMRKQPFVQNKPTKMLFQGPERPVRLETPSGASSLEELTARFLGAGLGQEGRSSTPQMRFGPTINVGSFSTDRPQSATPRPTFVPSPFLQGPSRIPPSFSADLEYEPPVIPERFPLRNQHAPAVPSGLRVSATTPRPDPPQTGFSNGNIMVVDPRTFTIDDDARSLQSPYNPHKLLAAAFSATFGSTELGATIPQALHEGMDEEVDQTDMHKPDAVKGSSSDEYNVIASDEGDSEWEELNKATQPKKAKDTLRAKGVAQPNGVLQSKQTAQPKDSASPESVVAGKKKKVAFVEEIEDEEWAAPKTVIVEEAAEEAEEPSKKPPLKGAKARRKEDAKRKEQEAKRAEEERKKEEARKREEAARLAEEARRKEEEQREREVQRREEQMHRQGSQAKQSQNTIKLKAQEKKREELQKQPADEVALGEETLVAFLQQQEETRQRVEGRQGKDSAAAVPDLKTRGKGKAAVADKKEVTASQGGDDLSKWADALMQKEADLAQKAEELRVRELALVEREREEARRQEEDKRRKPGPARKKEDELRAKEKELQQRAEELRKREEALGEMLARIHALHDEFQRKWP